MIDSNNNENNNEYGAISQSLPTETQHPLRFEQQWSSVSCKNAIKVVRIACEMQKHKQERKKLEHIQDKKKPYALRTLNKKGILNRIHEKKTKAQNARAFFGAGSDVGCTW